MFCRMCGGPQGHCLPTCPVIGQQLQQSIKDQIDQFKQSQVTAENSRRRNGGNRSKIANPALTKVNVTAYPAAMDPYKRKPIKLEKGSPVNIVFTMDATYIKVLNDVQERLFPYPEWKLAQYKLATAGGAIILEDTPFANFPFNLGGRGGRKALWLVRLEDDDPAWVDPDQTHDFTDIQSDNFSDTVHPQAGRSLSPVAALPSASLSVPQVSLNVFGLLSGATIPKFEDVYDNAKDSSGLKHNAVAILRQYDISCNPPRWIKTAATRAFSAPRSERCRKGKQSWLLTAST